MTIRQYTFCQFLPPCDEWKYYQQNSKKNGITEKIFETRNNHQNVPKQLIGC